MSIQLTLFLSRDLSQAIIKKNRIMKYIAIYSYVVKAGFSRMAGREESIEMKNSPVASPGVNGVWNAGGRGSTGTRQKTSAYLTFFHALPVTVETPVVADCALPGREGVNLARTKANASCSRLSRG